MPPLDRKEFSSIKPALIEFDDANDLLDYVFEQSIGAPEPEMVIIEQDIAEALYTATQIVKKERWLRSFMRTCGHICVEGVIDYEDPGYAKLREQAVINPTHPESKKQLDAVIRHFAPQVSTFEELYGAAPTPAKKVETPKKAKQPEKEQLEIELPDGHAFIYRNSLSLIMANEEISPALKTVMRLGIRKSGVRFEELRNHAVFKKLYKNTDIPELKRDFVRYQEESNVLLQQHGIKPKWLTTGKARGTRYTLVQVTSEIEPVEDIDAMRIATPSKATPRIAAPKKATPRKRPTAPPKPSRSERLDLAMQRDEERNKRAAERDALRTESAVIELVNMQPESIMVARRVIAFLENTYGMSRTQARDFLNSVLNKGGLYPAGTVDGRKRVAAKPVEVTKSKPTNGPSTSGKVGKKQEFKPSSQVTREILDAYIRSRNWDKRFSVKVLSNIIGLDELELKPFMALLTERNILKRSEGWRNRGSPRTKKQMTLLYEFVNRETWYDYKADPEKYLRDLAEIPKSEA